MSKYYESTPWDIKDIESCLSPHEEPQYEISSETRFDDHENIRQSLMSPGQKPAYTDPLIYLLKIIGENAYYSILEGESGAGILLHKSQSFIW